MQPTDFQTEDQVVSYFNDLLNPAIFSQNWNTVISLTNVFMQSNSNAHFASIGQSDMMTLGMYNRAIALGILGQRLESNQLLTVCRPRLVAEGEYDLVKDLDELFVTNNKVVNSTKSQANSSLSADEVREIARDEATNEIANIILAVGISMFILLWLWRNGFIS